MAFQLFQKLHLLIYASQFMTSQIIPLLFFLMNLESVEKKEKNTKFEYLENEQRLLDEISFYSFKKTMKRTQTLLMYMKLPWILSRFLTTLRNFSKIIKIGIFINRNSFALVNENSVSINKKFKATFQESLNLCQIFYGIKWRDS